MTTQPDLLKIAAGARLTDQYGRQLDRVRQGNQQTDCIEETIAGVEQVLQNWSTGGSIVIYGEPQSGKTEMMICLTARLLDQDHKVVVHLMNDSIDLLRQNLDRFTTAGLAPAPRLVTDLVTTPLTQGQAAIIFCKKNQADLQKLIAGVADAKSLVVIDDEADYATPNARVNQGQRTRINGLIDQLLGRRGTYIGVTATPARLNLNNTFDNKAEHWVRFRTHGQYTGQDEFFPLEPNYPYRLRQISGLGDASDAEAALVRFLVTAAYLNLQAADRGEAEQNWTFLVHTSGRTADHLADRQAIERMMHLIADGSGRAGYLEVLASIHQEARALYPDAEPDAVLTYVVANASRHRFVVLNSKRDRQAAGDRPTLPTCPFTIIIGGNIISRGVTFPNLLAMLFTRDVQSRLQQDTYIQRARMFGSRGDYLRHFELTIPGPLYGDWHRCFVFHRLALGAIVNNENSPVWIADARIAVAASSSIDRVTVDLMKGEMSFQMFDADVAKLDDVVRAGPTDVATLRSLADAIGMGLPDYLIEYIERDLKPWPGTLAIHTASSISGYKSGIDKKQIARQKGFIGKPQLEEKKFPGALHHVKIFYNDDSKARVFYKRTGGSLQFVQNLQG